jgi:hypothetical protein
MIMYRILVAALVSVFVANTSAIQLQQGWRVTTEFVPRDTTVESIPVRQLDSSWAAASPLRLPGFPNGRLV